MDWQCNRCAVWVSIRKEQCTSCGQHWSKVWKKPNGRRSQSRRKKETSRQEEQGAKDIEPEEDLALFTGKTPWIASTPNTRLSQPSPATMASSGKEEGTTGEVQLPPEPILPKPPQQNSLKVIEHLKGLKDVMGQLPEELETRLQQLEAAQGAEKALSHAHLNRLVKLQRQLRTQREKIQKLDSDWKQFVVQVLEKFNKHKGLFVDTRKQLIQVLQEKQAELEAAKDEISKASLSLLQQPDQVEEVEDIELDDGSLMATLMEAQGQCAALDEYPEIDMEGVDDEELKQDSTTPVVKAFTRRATAGSPTKVAKEHLKSKDSKSNNGPKET